MLLGSLEKTSWVNFSAVRMGTSLVGSENSGHCSTILQPASGSNTLIAIAVSVVDFPKAFWSSTPSWLIMKVITPELPYDTFSELMSTVICRGNRLNPK